MAIASSTSSPLHPRQPRELDHLHWPPRPGKTDLNPQLLPSPAVFKTAPTCEGPRLNNRINSAAIGLMNSDSPSMRLRSSPPGGYCPLSSSLSSTPRGVDSSGLSHRPPRKPRLSAPLSYDGIYRHIEAPLSTGTLFDNPSTPQRPVPPASLFLVVQKIL